MKLFTRYIIILPEIDKNMYEDFSIMLTIKYYVFIKQLFEIRFFPNFIL